jgi:hypothetical protein
MEEGDEGMEEEEEAGWQETEVSTIGGEGTWRRDQDSKCKTVTTSLMRCCSGSRRPASSPTPSSPTSETPRRVSAGAI